MRSFPRYLTLKRFMVVKGHSKSSIVVWFDRTLIIMFNSNYVCILYRLLGSARIFHTGSVFNASVDGVTL